MNARLFSLRFVRVLLWVGLALSASGCGPQAHAFDHSELDTVLKTYVKDGRVRYAALKGDPQLERYLGQLAAARPDALGDRPAELAFWINAYNAYTLKLIVDHYPVASIKDIPHGKLKSVWDLPVARVAGATYSLNAIEHEILRARLKEPRIHYAVVCAAVSCPELRAEAFTGERLDEQLAAQAREFLSKQNRFDAQAKRAELSQIFQWFAVDFGTRPAAVLQALAPFAPAAVRPSLESEGAKWTVTYLDYDWALNSAQ